MHMNVSSLLFLCVDFPPELRPHVFNPIDCDGGCKTVIFVPAAISVMIWKSVLGH